MHDWALTVWSFLSVLWAGWCLQALLVSFQSGKFAHRVARPVRADFDEFHPSAAVIVPCKGADPELARNVRSLLTQQYPLYRVVFVFESDDDPARPVVETEAAQYPDGPRVDLLTAGIAPPTTGQKVHNQLVALRWLQEQNDRSELLCFADSDAVPGPHWLQKLAGPHVQPQRIGVTTGYRWLMPALRAQRPNLPSAIASVINSGVAMFMGHGELTQAWGGSMAVRRDFAEERDLMGYFEGALSDDYQLTRLCRDAGRRVYFVAHCLVPSRVEFSWAELFEFGRRQYLITRVHDPMLYFRALGVIGLYVVGMFSAWIALPLGLLTAEWGIAITAGIAILMVSICNQVRAGFRWQAVKAAFGRDQCRYLYHTLLLDRWGTNLVMLVNLALLLSALVGRQMTWRGKRYRLAGPQRVSILQQ